MKDKLIEQIKEQSAIMSNVRQNKINLEDELKNLLIAESGLEVNKQYFDKKNEKIWIAGFDLCAYRNKYKIKAITYKVKKDGTNGMQSHCSWGYDIDYIKKIEG